MFLIRPDIAQRGLFVYVAYFVYSVQSAYAEGSKNISGNHEATWHGTVARGHTKRDGQPGRTLGLQVGNANDTSTMNKDLQGFSRSLFQVKLSFSVPA